MSKEIAFIGRASCYSPQSMEKDRAILTAVRRQLQQWYDCQEMVQEDAMSALPPADAYVSMGRHPETLKQLALMEQQHKTVVNITAAVSLCNHRIELTRRLEEQGVAVPPLSGDHGYWVKRGDACRMTNDDVLYATTRQEALVLREKMQHRAINEVEVRAHVEGDWVKFYGVEGTDFFRAYQMQDDTASPIDCQALQVMAGKAAAAIGLEVYGGDCIIRQDGQPVIVDLNDWPSFSLCREDAAMAIALHIHQRIMLSEIQGLVFDYGGTLDTGGHHWGKVLWAAWQRAGVPVSEQQFREAYVHGERTLGRQPIIKPTFTFRQTLEAKLRLELEFVQQLPYLETILNSVYEETLRHTAHSREVLLQLSKRYPLVLVSNFYGNMPVVLEEFGFTGIFRQVIESAVVGIRKPDPRIFLMGVEALDLQPEQVAVVGDSIEKDIKPAREAGCKTVWLHGQQWTDEPVDERIPDIIISDLNEVL